MKIMFQNYSRSTLPKAFVSGFIKKCRRYLLARIPRRERNRLFTSQELVIVFVSDKKMQELNLRFRNRNYVTDILSFETEDHGALGELVLAPRKIRQQALEHDLTFREELSYLLIHGVLHLLGYEHEGSRHRARTMFKIQDEAFECLSGPIRRAKK